MMAFYKPYEPENWFTQKGINIHDPKWGAWVQGGRGQGVHQSWSLDYNREWEKFILENGGASIADIERQLNIMRVDPRWGGGF